MNFKSFGTKFLIYVLVIVFLSFLLVPLIEMVFTSLKPLEKVLVIPHPLIPKEFYFKTYTHEMWEQVPYLPRYFFNSIIISLAVMLISIGLASPAGYSLARFRFPGRRILLLSTLAINMFSPVILLVPLYRIMRVYHLINTYYAMILPGAAFTLPFSIWMLTGYFENIPKALEEAAQMDGASKLEALVKVVIPLAAPGMVTCAVYAFIVSWSQQFIFALVLATNREIMPITRGIYEYFGRNINQWNLIMGASVISVIPVLLIFIFLQKYLIKGIMGGAVKG